MTVYQDSDPPGLAESASDAPRQALMERHMRGMRAAFYSMAEEDVYAALQAPTDAGVLAWVASIAAADPAVVRLDPAARLIAEGANLKQELLTRAGGVFGAGQVAKILRLERQSVDKRRKAQSIIAVPMGDDFGYPACQFDQDGLVPDLADTLRAMPIKDPWMRLEWLLTPDSVLDDKSPLDVLKAGGRAEVLMLAAGHG